MYLILQTGRKKGRKFLVREGTNLIGRWDPTAGSFPEIDLDECDTDAKVSRKHAILKKSGDALTIKDIGSLNGTFINKGEKLEHDREYPVHVGDELVVGKLFLLVTGDQ
jgi:pSer/pThr/pTyr-binding forkhead associated (FHA) protein